MRSLTKRAERAARRGHSALRTTIVEAAARAAYVQAWADHVESKGRHLRGELMDQAPRTPSKARTWAKKLLATMERLNGLPVEEMYERAAAEGGSASDFGHYTAMQALGHGVAWSDDHPRHGFTIPHAEFHMDGARDFYAGVDGRRGIASTG